MFYKRMQFHNFVRIFLLPQLFVVLTLTDGFVAAGVDDGGASDNPMQDYLLRLQKYFESHLNTSLKDFPTSVVCLPDYDVQTNNTRSEVRDVGTFACAKSATCKIDWFLFNWTPQNNLKGFPLKESLIRVYKNRIGRHVPRYGGIVRVNISAYVDLHDALVFRSQKHNYSSSGTKEWVPVGSIDVKSDVADGEWLEVNLTSAILRKWNLNATSHIIRVALKLESATKLPIKIFNMAMLNKTAHEDQWKKKLSEQPHLVIFGDDLGLKEKVGASHKLGRMPSHGHGSNRNKRFVTNGCSFQDFRITFKDLGMDHIVIPRHLNVGICMGVCNNAFLSLNPQKGTNHAHIMTTAYEHFKNSNETSMTHNNAKPKLPCCVPTDHSAVYIMEYYSSALYIQLYPKLVAKSCGCV